MDYQYELIKLKAQHTRVKAMHDQQVANLQKEIAQLRELINNPVNVPHFDQELMQVLDVVVSVTNVLAADILGTNRKREVVTARGLFSYIARIHCKKEWTLIGRFLNKHHSTIIHQVNTYEDFIKLNYTAETRFYNDALNRINDAEGQRVPAHLPTNRSQSYLLCEKIHQAGMGGS